MTSNQIRFGSVCSGIEAASVAWHPLGWRAAWLAEIEPFPCAVLAHHYPGVPNLGDMTTITQRVLSGEVVAPDVFAGGTPCQAFSVAGLRRSLDDARGNLSITFCEIANAIDTTRSIRGEQPCVVMWENVPGVLSTKDNAFGCFLAELVGGDEPLTAPAGKWTDAGCVSGPKRTAAWRVLDAQYFGLAQRRRRVFVVASAREGFDPAEVLFEFEGVRRDIAPRREAREGITQESVPSIAGSLDTQCGGQRLTHQSAANGHIIGTITARMFNALGPRDVEEGAVIPVAFDAYNQLLSGDLSKTVASRADQDTASLVAFHPTQDPISSSDGTTHAMGCGSSGGSATVAIAAEMAVRRLTPRECERLQGFPDDYTAIPWRGRPASECPDGPRYKALGNSWAVPCAAWIGKRIAQAMAGNPDRAYLDDVAA